MMMAAIFDWQDTHARSRRVKRDLVQCQKRPLTVSKETYYSVLQVCRIHTHTHTHTHMHAHTHTHAQTNELFFGHMAGYDDGCNV
jgi:hypothetical protein